MFRSVALPFFISFFFRLRFAAHTSHLFFLTHSYENNNTTQNDDVYVINFI